MKSKGLPIFAILLALLLCATPSQRLAAEVLGRIAAVVGDEVITENDIAKALSLRARSTKFSPGVPLLESSRERGKESAKAANRAEVLERLIDNAILGQVLAKSKIEVTEDDLARAIAGVLHQNRMTIDQLKSEVAAKGMSYDEYKKQLEREIKKVKFINQVIGPKVKITDQDLRDHYEKNRDRFRGGSEAHIAEIVLPLEGIRSQQEFDELGQSAVTIAQKASKGGSFEALARQYSKGPNAAQGGDMGTVKVRDLSPQVAAAVKALQIGEVSPPLMAEHAIVIVKLLSLPEKASGDFERRRDDIYSAVYDRKVDEALAAYLDQERQKIFVEVR